MKRQKALSIAIAVLVLIPVSTALAAEETRTLTGEYRSGFQDGPRELEAIFTAAGDEAWEVVFHFDFNGRDYTYTGTAEGDLSTGQLTGTAVDERGRRTFTFRGEFDDGTFRGRHAETTRGRERSTGTLTLSG